MKKNTRKLPEHTFADIGEGIVPEGSTVLIVGFKCLVEAKVGHWDYSREVWTTNVGICVIRPIDCFWVKKFAQPNLSSSAIQVLVNVYNGDDVDYHVHGRSAYGGLQSTMAMLHRYRYLHGVELTPKGKKFVDDREARIASEKSGKK